MQALFSLEEDQTQRKEQDRKTQQDTDSRQDLCYRLVADEDIFQSLHTPVSRKNFGCVLHGP